MYRFTRTKSVTDPLDDKVKAQIIRYETDHVSSGSEHSAHADDDVTSPSLSELFFGFCGDPEKNDSGPERDYSSMCYSSCGNADLTEMIVVDLPDDEFRNVLQAHVLRAIQGLSCLRSDKQIARRSVMAFLRHSGYDAAVCKTRWDKSGGLTAGSSELIDVVSAAGTRYLVDLDFASEFEIARPTEAYERLRQRLPEVFVGNGEDLSRILKAMSEGARRSLKNSGLHQPPWRKHQYMRLKWLGSYRRTVNLFPASVCAADRSFGSVDCRAVGFDAAVYGGCTVAPRAK